MRITLIIAVIVVLQGISIPMKGNTIRCMMVYTNTAEETVKLDFRFPAVHGGLPNELYIFSVTNTEDDTETMESLVGGSYKRELDLIENVLYRVCFSLDTQRNVGAFRIEFQVLRKFDHELSSIKVPSSLLNRGELVETYKTAQHLNEIMKEYAEASGQKKQLGHGFVELNEEGEQVLIKIAIMELLLLLTVNVIQFWCIKCKLDGVVQF